MHKTLDVIILDQLILKHPEVLDYLGGSDENEMHRLATEALEVGVSVLSRVKSTQNLDYVDAKVSETLHVVDKRFEDLVRAFEKQIETSLDPTEDSSFLGKAKKTIDEHNQLVRQQLSEVIRDARVDINSEIQRLTGMGQDLDKKFDPNNAVGYLGILVDRIKAFERALDAQFSETDQQSFVGKLRSLVEQHFGPDGTAEQLLNEKLRVDDSAPLGQIQRSLKEDISSLRDAFMQHLGEQQLLAQTTIKGFSFEEEVFAELQRIAKPFADIVEDTSKKSESITGSKKGDFVYQFGSKRVVLDAKNYNKLRSLPAMLTYIKDAMEARDSDYGVIVAPDANSLQKQVGSWNCYGKCIITPLDSLEITIKYIKSVDQAHHLQESGINVGRAQQKIAEIEQKLKDVTTIKTKLSKLNNGVVASVEELQQLVSRLKSEISVLLSEIGEVFT